MELTKEELQLIYEVLNKEIGGYDKAKFVLALAAKLQAEKTRLDDTEDKK